MTGTDRGHEDEWVRFRHPSRWTLRPARHNTGYYLTRGRDRLIALTLFPELWSFDHMEACVRGAPADGIGRYEVREDWAFGDNTAVAARWSLAELRGFKGTLRSDGRRIFVDAHLRDDEDEADLAGILASVELRGGPHEPISAEMARLQREDRLREAPKVIDATRPRKRPLRRVYPEVWADHFMFVLHDRDAAWESDFDEGELTKEPLITRPGTVWVPTQTEFDIRVQFEVHDEEPKKPLPGARHASAALAVPSGRLLLEQTTGGAWGDYRVRPGDYRVDVAWSAVEATGNLPGAEGERVSVRLVPVEASNG